jgi:hypothetical protein
MSHTSTLVIYTGLLLTGLAGSLHCVGMCGPILLGFSEAFDRVALTIKGQPRGRRLVWDFLWYHAGRIWTYAAMGFLAGWLGQALHQGSAWMGYQRAASVSLSAVVILAGMTLLGIVPAWKPNRWASSCSFDRRGSPPWLRSLVRGSGVVPRLLLGVVMGLLPCGLVYAALAIAAGLSSPWHSAVGMAVFGLGTVPSLTAVLLSRRLIPTRLRPHGVKLAAAMIALSGLWMMARSLTPHDHDHSAHHASSHPPAAPPADR